MAEPIAEATMPKAERVIPVTDNASSTQPTPPSPSQSPTEPAPLSSLGLKASSSSDMDMLNIFRNVYHPTINPSGYVNLGVAENSLMHNHLTSYINNNNNAHPSSPPSITAVTPRMLTYGDGGMGSTRLRGLIARFLTRHLKPLKTIEADHVIVTNGCSSAIEHCAFLLSEPGECWLLGQPYYGTFPLDLTFRPGAVVLPVAFGEGVDPLSVQGVKRYEETLLKAQAEGKKVKGLILCHPHNPLGRCYPHETIEGLMRLCGRYGLHFVSDEIYALSVWENKEEDTAAATTTMTATGHAEGSSASNTPGPPIVPFVSSATIDPLPLGLPPSNHHVLWGLSKDFGANGLRVGVVISQHNDSFIRALTLVSFYSYISSLVDNLACNILADDVFTNEYIAENQSRLSEAYSRTCKLVKSKGIHYERGGNAGFFLWLDLGRYFVERYPGWKAEVESRPKDRTETETETGGTNGLQEGGEKVADEHALTDVIMNRLMDAKVFLASGTAFGSERPGWFRLVFTQDEGIVAEGVQRIVDALGQRRSH